MVADQANMWAVLCEPPERLVSLINEMIQSTSLNQQKNLREKFNQTSFVWNTIDLDEVDRKFRIACVRYALSTAKKVQSDPLPGYWNQVESACKQVIDALNGTGDLGYAAAAADAAAYAARDAAYAARDAAYAAAYAAARAAYAAARAAYVAAARAAYVAAAYVAAAYADAYVAIIIELFDILIDIILEEYENKA